MNNIVNQHKECVIVHKNSFKSYKLKQRPCSNPDNIK